MMMVLLITFHHTKRKQTIGDVQVEKAMLYYIKSQTQNQVVVMQKLYYTIFLSGVLEMFFISKIRQRKGM